MQETAISTTKSLNWLDKSIKILDKVGIFSRWTNVIGIAFLFLMVLFTTLDVIMRYIFNQPMVWVLEITEVLMIVAIFLAVSHTQNEKGHISIDIMTSQLKPKPKLMLEFITTMLSLGTIVVVFWRVVAQTLFFISRNSSQSQFLTLPKAPFAAILALGCITLALLLLRDLLQVASRSQKMGLNRSQWAIMFMVPVLSIVLVLLWMQQDLWVLSLPLVGLLGVLFSLLLFLIGMPISFSLILTAFVFTAHIRGSASALDTLGTEIYRNAGSYSWSVLPFFVMMGFFCFHARFGEDLYLAAYKWFGHMRGGLAIATVAACTGFAAIVGDGVAATATIGTVAVPEMRKYGYDDRLSTGSVTSGATLGPIIPPSTLFIIYGVLTSVSIGSLFVAGILPGLLIAAIFCIIIAFWCRLNPNVGPAGTRSNWKDRIISLKAGGPVLILFILVIGGIYSGIFTPTEGGAIGAMGAFVIGLIVRRWTRRTFFNALLDSGKTVSMVFLILIGALIFTRFAAWCNLSGSITSLINNSGLTASTFMVITLLVLMMFGFFIDIMPLVLIGVPILYPVATGLGINPIWFGIMFCIIINLGALTPPVGINLFVFKGMFKEIPMGIIYRGAIPFALGTFIAIVIMFVAPSIVTWLPGIIK
ncbi:MAG: TRAP transporter large permease subunit [Dehalococcoidales bacterium]|nr:TRAP transporter large permease subunit [Dehalococcoidales bacterium]